jgi:hypothetical protein
MRVRFVIIFALLGVLIAAAIGLFVLMRPLVMAPAVTPVAPAAATLPRLSTPTPSATPSPSAVAKTPAPKATNAPTPTPEAAPTTATLIFESDVPDTGVFIDRVYVGQAPVTAKDIKPGPHTINVSATGYDGFADTIDIAAGTRTLSYKFKEVRLNASTAVVHKHAIGSCSGTLRATPKGLAYDTEDANDHFSVALTDLETFTVDYLQKNLRVKIKGGKTYNFTDPDGNADKLLAFHSAVDKVRQRLVSGKRPTRQSTHAVPSRWPQPAARR